jgi:hypothetical protein
MLQHIDHIKKQIIKFTSKQVAVVVDFEDRFQNR